MKNQSLITVLAAAGVLVPAFAQTVLKMPEKKTPPANSGTLASTKSTAAKSRFSSRLPISDQLLKENYLSEFGALPVISSPLNSPFGPEDDTQYTYTGFNITAGDNNGSPTGGFVNFNLDPFACDTVSSDPGGSPYSFVMGENLYSILPEQDWKGAYVNTKVTVYDANTLEPKSNQTFEVDHDGNMSYVPYIISYDDQRNVVYAISMENTTIKGMSATNYYLNIYDPEEGAVKRLGFIGNWIDGKDAKDQYSVKGFCCGYGTLYVQYVADKVMIGKIDPTTCKTTVIGTTEIPAEYVYGMQPMIYDTSAGSLLVNHYDFNFGTQYYKVGTWDQGDGTVSTNLIESTPTGFNFFYRRPETLAKPYSNKMEEPSNFTVTPNADNSELTISFTVPSKLEDGSEIEYPSWVMDNQKGVRVNFAIDNNFMTVEGVSNFIPYGTEVTATVPLKGGWMEIGEGLHTYTLILNSLYNELNIPRLAITDYLGNDAPGVVNNAALAINDGVASISWSAPIESRYSDFGTSVDLSKVVYKVVRDYDGKVVADGISETTCTDTPDSEEYIGYTYTIYPSVEGVEGQGATTNKVNFGQYVTLPWEENFQTSDSLDGWTVLNINNDGTFRTWTWNSIYHSLFCLNGIGDDWAITPPLRLESGKIYELYLDLEGEGELNLWFGEGDSPETQTNKIATVKSTDGIRAQRFYFTPSEAGNFRVGIHNYNGKNDSFKWTINSIAVKEVSTGDAPAAPADVAFTPAEPGELYGVVSAVMPTLTNNGAELKSLSKMYVYDSDGNKVGEADATPGEKAEASVATTKGWNPLKVVAVNEAGEGYPVVLKTYAGHDVPQKISGLKARWSDQQNKAVLSWDVPTAGVHGGYVDADELEYVIYRLDTEPYYQRTKLGTINEPTVDVSILDNDKQYQYTFSVTAVSSEGESEFADVGIVLGEPYKLPILEPLGQQGLSTSPWLLMPVTNGQNWNIDGEFYNDNIKSQNNDGYQLVFANTGNTDGSGRFVSPIIDLTSVENPVMKIWLHHTPGLSDKTYAVIEASTDGSKNYTPLCEPISLGGGNGWQQHVVSLASLIGKKAQIGITAYVPTPQDRVFADNFEMVEASGSDIALTGIATTSYCKAGETVPVAVTVANMGATELSDFSVMFNVNGAAVDEVMDETPLPAGCERKYTFNLNVNSADDGVTKYYAEVIADADANDSNNISNEVTVSLIPVDLPAPTNLTRNEDNLNWDAPEIGEGRQVTLDFENIAAFSTDNIEGWTTFDGDGHRTMTFIQYYDNYWPYSYQPLAWMTWSPKEAGCPTAEVWQPFQGDKCLVAWGNYGEDYEGRPNADEPEDDWFISPEILGNTDFSFMTLANDPGCMIEVLYSTTDNNPESFTGKVVDVEYSEKSVWKEVSARLPEDARYVALHVTANPFGILVDNICYTEAHTPQLKGYNVYRFGPVLESFADSNNAVATTSVGYAVSAVYDLGESSLSNWTKDSGVDGIITDALNAKVMTGRGFISISGADNKNVIVSAANGMAIHNAKVSDDITLNVPAGIYIVKVGDKAVKVVVK